VRQFNPASLTHEAARHGAPNAVPGLTTALTRETSAMANHDSTTTLDDADEREARVVEILASGVLDVLPESPERAGRVLRRAQEMHAEIAARGPTALAEAMMRVRE